MAEAQDPRKGSNAPLHWSVAMLLVSAGSFAWLGPMEHDYDPAFGAAAGSLVLAAAVGWSRGWWVKTLASCALAALVLFTPAWILSSGHHAFRAMYHYGHVTYVLLGNVVLFGVVRWLLARPSLEYHFATDAGRARIDREIAGG
jgi:hypothetical protein